MQNHIAKHPLHKHYQPPNEPNEEHEVSIFLAGSIAMGRAIFWQKRLGQMLWDLPIAVYNPRRDDFEENLRQHIDEPEFKEQVDWESKYLKESTVIALYLQPGTVSPISLLELGRYAESRKVIVCCQDGFGKKGNVQIVCSDHNIVLVETWEDFVKEVRQAMETLCKTGRIYRLMAKEFSKMSRAFSWMSKVCLACERHFLGW